MTAIRITTTPAGEAPEHVRRAWVGLVLPAFRHRQGARGLFAAFGVVSGPKSFAGTVWRRLRGKYLRYDGYAVPASTAVSILQQSDPGAAQWWRDHAPHLLRSNGYLIFEAGACEELPEGP